MKQLKERGFEFKGWKLGQKINLKNEAGIYEIIGFAYYEEDKTKIGIAIDKPFFESNISESGVQNLIYCNTEKNGFSWITSKDIETLHKSKIEKLVEFRKFIINATKEDLDNHLETALRNWLDPVIDELTIEGV